MVQVPTEAEANETLRGQQIAITGRLASMTQDEASELIARCGGETTRLPGRRTSMLVVGQEGWPFQEDGRITEGLERARRLQDEGSALEVVTEQAFLELVGLAGEGARSEFRRLYTTTQLSRILKIPGRRIRSWVRRGLIRPARTEQRLDYFDFRQVTELRMLAELTEKGVALEEIRRSLEQLRRWVPEAEQSLVQLARLKEDGHLLVRLEDGHLAEPSGQLRIAFGEARDKSEAAREAETPAPPGSAKVIPARPRYSFKSPVESGDWFERAVELEDQDQLEEAARAYEQAFLEEPTAETAFNLGNVLYALGDSREALGRFQQAVELDEDYAEAWNNLASVYAELEQWEEAVEAGERALALDPGYPDAHYNLAQALHACGRKKEARRHGRTYLEHDRQSEWSRRLRLSLGLA